MRNVEAEMIRSHELCLKISSKKPTDPDYKSLLEELFRCEIDDSVAIVSPFYCDCGCRMTIGKNVTINKGATILYQEDFPMNSLGVSPVMRLKRRVK